MPRNDSLGGSLSDAFGMPGDDSLWGLFLLYGLCDFIIKNLIHIVQQFFSLSD